MPRLDLSRPHHYETVAITVFRRALPPEVCVDLALSAFDLAGDLTQEVTRIHRGARHFRSSRIMGVETVPALEEVLSNDFGGVFSTLRLNVQGPNGAQGWHQDYIPEPLVFYPSGTGYIDVNLHAKTIEEARNRVYAEEIVSVPISVGDVAVLERGDEIYHRGRNASAEEVRITGVLH